MASTLGYPVFVKPANLGSSVGISKAKREADLAAAIDLAAEFDRKVVIEAAVPNAREIEIAVLGNDSPEVSVPGEVIPSREFYDYEAKYLDDDSRTIIPADLPANVTAEVKRLAIEVFRAVDCAGMARVDFLMDGATGKLYVNEINTIPGFTTISMYSKMWAASGVPIQTSSTASSRSPENATPRNSRFAPVCREDRGRLAPADVAGRARRRRRAHVTRTARQGVRPDPRGAVRRSRAAAEIGVPARAAAGVRRHRRRERLLAAAAESRGYEPRCRAARSASTRRSARPRHGSRASRSERKPGSISAARTARACCSAVIRGQYLAAARDGKRIHDSLQLAISLDPSLGDAYFGLGLYHYYAAIAPRAARILSMLMFLPGGDRAGGLKEMEQTRSKGLLLRGEADYQLHLIYLWYERQPTTALRLIEGLRTRYPDQPGLLPPARRSAGQLHSQPSGSAADVSVDARGGARGAHRGAGDRRR